MIVEEEYESYKIKLRDLFEKYGDEYIRFERIENKKSSRPDIHAMILLNEIVPGDRDIVSASEHDEFWLDIDCEKLAEIITDEQVIELRRCGVHYDEEVDSLGMFT